MFKGLSNLNAMESYEEKKTNGLSHGTIRRPCIIKHDKPIGNTIPCLLKIQFNFCPVSLNLIQRVVCRNLGQPPLAER